MARQTKIRLKELIYPLFVKEGKGLREKIPSMPGVYRYSKDTLVKEALGLKRMGIKNILLFGVPRHKSWDGNLAYCRNNTVSQAIRLLKNKIPEITLMSDICLCAYTLHGHCGLVRRNDRRIDRISTLKVLSKMALSHAQAGVDFVAPSAMVSGQVKAIRKILDNFGFKKTKIMGYSAKFASNFYGPFRDIVNSAPRFGDRKGYQLDYIKVKSALNKVNQDIKQGAEIVMVKPALSYLDIIKEVKLKFNFPLAAYNVSGEYSLVKKGADLGFWKEREIVFEIVDSIKRAGADFIITYHAKDIARWLNSK